MTIRGLMVLSVFRRNMHVITRSKTNVKPASPTPTNLKRYNLPLYDCIVPDLYVPLLFFYNANPDTTTSTISSLLKKSFSETLSTYYPFAGRLRVGLYIDCSDQGVDFTEAQIGCKLSDVLGNKDHKYLGHLFPPHSVWDVMPNYDASLVRVQLNHFNCGGLAIAASVSHRLGDGATMCSFLCYWANLMRSSGDHQKLLHLHPHFPTEVVPQTQINYNEAAVLEAMFATKNWLTREIVFHNTKLAALKANVQMEHRDNGVVEDIKYTRNELLTALLYRCAVASKYAGASVLCQTVNMRRMMEPPLPETSVGNLVAPVHFPTTTESEIKLSSVAQKIREGKRQLIGTKKGDGFEYLPPLLQKYVEGKHRIVLITSICNFPIYEEMDFGWGRPIKVSLVGSACADTITLMDTENRDGIIAVVGMEEKDMEKFLGNQELLTYASFE